MQSSASELASYAHIIFYGKKVDEPGSPQVHLLGVFERHLLKIPRPAPLVIPELKVRVEIIVGMNESVNAIAVKIRISDEVWLSADLDGARIEKAKGVVLAANPEAKRFGITQDYPLENIEFTQDEDLVVEVLLNGKLLNHQALKIRFVGDDDAQPLIEKGEATAIEVVKRDSPAIPSLVLIPKDGIDEDAIYATAVAYADAGLMVSAEAKNRENIALAFPAIVCSAFAIELFLKYIVISELRRTGNTVEKYPKGHGITELWKDVSPSSKQLVAGMFRNPSGPATTGIAIRLQQLESALLAIGNTPFVKWRYAYEISEVSMMSHGQLAEVVNALGDASHYLRRKDKEGKGD